MLQFTVEIPNYKHTLTITITSTEVVISPWFQDPAVFYSYREAKAAALAFLREQKWLSENPQPIEEIME